MSLYDYESVIASIPDYPEPGVIFKDITPLFADPAALKAAVTEIAVHFRAAGVTKVVGPEARGFMVGVPLAIELGAGFVPARKPGKLPRAVYAESYELEYGTDSIEVHQDAIEAGDVVLIADDLIATGGTAEAVAKLVKRMGGELVGYGFILELSVFNAREKLCADGSDLFSLVQVDTY